MGMVRMWQALINNRVLESNRKLDSKRRFPFYIFQFLLVISRNLN